MKFEIIDKNTRRKIRNNNRWYINGEGELFIDCDPTGINMNGKRTICLAPDKFIVKIEND